MNETLIHIGLCILAVIVMIVLVVKIINLGFQLIGWIVGKIFFVITLPFSLLVKAIFRRGF